MKKWFLMVPFLLVAIKWVAIESFERYSKVPVCEAEIDGRGASLHGCSAYDQILAGNYRVIKGEVYWERKNYAPEFGCGQGPGAIAGNLISFKCWMQRDGYARTVEHRSLTKVEKLSPSFRVLESEEPGLLTWQKEQFNDYAVGEQGVYRYGRRLEGADPKDFSVIFPLGDQEHWRFLDISRSGKSTFVGRKNLGEVDLTQFRLLEPSDCPKVNAGCSTDDLAELLRSGDDVVGSVGNDVVVLRAYDSVRIDNKASPGMYIFTHGANRYVHTREVLYQLSAPNYENVKNSDGELEDKIWFRRVFIPQPKNSQKYLAWQREQFLNYGVSEDGVYFNGLLLEDADPKNFEVVFPFGTAAGWVSLNLSKSGNSSYVGKWKVENTDFRKLEVMLPCTVSEADVTDGCWTLERMANSVRDTGVVARLGEDIFYFYRGGVRRYIGAVLLGSHVLEQDGGLFLSGGGKTYIFEKSGYGFYKINTRPRKE
jgi:hypothetical protein